MLILPGFSFYQGWLGEYVGDREGEYLKAPEAPRHCFCVSISDTCEPVFGQYLAQRNVHGLETSEAVVSIVQSVVQMLPGLSGLALSSLVTCGTTAHLPSPAGIRLNTIGLSQASQGLAWAWWWWASIWDPSSTHRKCSVAQRATRGCRVQVGWVKTCAWSK